MFLRAQRVLFAFLFITTVFFTANPSSLLADWEMPPYQFPETTGPSKTAVASDANGHAFVVFGDTASNTVFASYYGLGAWQPAEAIGSGVPFDIAIAMDDSGTALVIWLDALTLNILTANFNGSTWNTSSPSPLSSVGTLLQYAVAVSMNGPNEGVAVWVDFSTSNVWSSFFTGSSWTTPITIGTGITNPTVDYSTNGTAIAGWSNGPVAGGARVSNYIGGSWQPEVILDPTTNSGARVGIDANGNAHAVWLDAVTFDVFSSDFNGTLWSAPQLLSLASGNRSVNIGVAPNGTAVATWIDSALAGQSSIYNGSSWSAPVQFTAGPINNSIIGDNVLSVNNNGDAIAVWKTNANELKSARLPLGQAWEPEEIIDPLTGALAVAASLSANGTVFATWNDTVNSFATVNLSIVLPPSNLQGTVCRNNFAFQTDIVNTITWTPSIDPNVQFYNLSRDGVLIATIPSTGPFIYLDHQRCCKVVYIYSLVSVGINGIQSTPITVTVVD